MAGGVSKFYERSWTYDVNGTRFEDNVGRILSKGHNLQATFKAQALETAKKAIAFEDEVAASRNYDPTKADSSFLNQTGSSSSKPAPDTKGWVWVDKEGTNLGPVGPQDGPSQLGPPPTPKMYLTTEKQKTMANMSDLERSMHMWRKINPGCMEPTTRLPKSTYNSHFGPLQPGAVEPTNKEYYRQKTDFTVWADQKVKYAATMPS